MAAARKPTTGRARRRSGDAPHLPDAPRSASLENAEAEVSVLGAMILNNETIDVVVPALAPDAFASAAHRKMYEAILSLHDRRQAVDFVTLREELDRLGTLEAVGGADYVSRICDAVPAAANAEHYAEIVREKAVMRDLLRAAREIYDEAGNGAEHSRELLDRAQARIFDIAERGMRTSVTPMREALKAAFAMIERSHEGMLTGIATGYPRLDEYTNGFQPGELLILAARPSMGKTSLALNVAEHVGVHLGDPVAIFSLEMGREQLARNMLCSHVRLDSHRVRRGRLTDGEREALGQHVGDLYEAPIFIDDSPSLNCFELRAKVRRLKATNDLKLVIVDYLQLMEGPDIESRVQQISAISRSLKGLAREMRIPILALAQLNRQVETRDNHRPRMADLRESGSLEQDADVVMLLHRAGYYNQDPDDGSAELIIAKQRNGPTGAVKLTFLRQYMRFETAAEGFEEP